MPTELTSILWILVGICAAVLAGDGFATLYRRRRAIRRMLAGSAMWYPTLMTVLAVACLLRGLWIYNP